MIEYAPVVLDKDTYWLICVPVPPDHMNWAWKCLVWRKGDDQPLTTMYKRTIGDAEAEAATFMIGGRHD